MATISYTKVQAALNALQSVEKNLNELEYYKKLLKDANHSTSLCSSVRSAISRLSNQHAKLVEALAVYGYGHLQTDAALAAAQHEDYSADDLPMEFTYTPAPEHEKGFWEKTANQIVLGDYSEDVTWLGTGVSFVLALFGVDAPMDARDLTANIQKGEYGWAAVNALSLLPVLGVFCKGAKVVDTSTTLIKQGGNVIDASTTIGKGADKYAVLYDVNKVIGETKAGRLYLQSKDVILRIDADGTIVSVKNVGLVENYKFVLRENDELKKMRYAFGHSEMSADDALKQFQSMSVDELKELGYGDEAIELISKDIMPESIKSSFIKSLTNDDEAMSAIQEYLAAQDYSPADIQEFIEGMKKGRLLTGSGLEVHHKLPLKDSGTNTFDNFILIDEKSHNIFTGYQKTATNGIDGYEYVDWPVPKGNICLSGYSAVEFADIDSAIQDMLKK